MVGVGPAQSREKIEWNKKLFSKEGKEEKMMKEEGEEEKKDKL